jgi:hypothetical protein
MTPAEHAKAIEDAAEQYAYAYSIDDFKDRCRAFDVLQAAVWAGVSANKMVAAPDGWQLVPVEPTAPMLSKMAECDGYLDGDRDRPGLIRWEDYWRNALAAAPKP